jgi:hypothetical protein
MPEHRHAERDDHPLHRPLTPLLLAEMGVLDRTGFSPEDNSVHSFRIWGNHGHHRFQNKTMGVCTIRRDSTAESGRQRFRIHKEIVNADCIVQRIDTDMECALDSASVVQWNAVYSFTDSEGNTRETLSRVVRGICEKKVLTISHGTAVRRFAIDSPLHSLPTRIATIGSWKNRDTRFAFLDGFDVVKRGHRCVRDATRDESGGPLPAPFRCITQYGEGIVPIDYWIDSSNAVAVIVANSMAWIRDRSAVEKKEQLIDELKRGTVHYEY